MAGGLDPLCPSLISPKLAKRLNPGGKVICVWPEPSAFMMWICWFGGGTALLRCVPAVEDTAAKLRGDERLGAEIVARALEKPVRTIAENSGVDGAVVADEVRTRSEKSPNIGYNANSGEYEDMFRSGIVDPAKVTRSALENAASIAGLMLTTEVMVTKIDEDEPKNKVAGAIR